MNGPEPGKLIVIGGSAGALSQLTQIVSDIPGGVGASICVVLHTAPGSVSYLPQILERAGALRAVHATTGPIEPGCIYVAPPNRHLLVEPGGLHVYRGAHENGHRPAIDPLFRTAAASYGGDTVGVVLSGNLDDGTEGLAEIKARGGTAIVVDPATSPFPGMPSSAIEYVAVDHVLPAEQIADTLMPFLTLPPVARNGNRPGERGPDPVELDLMGTPTERAGNRTEFTCPECHGTLWEEPRGKMSHFRCRTGHAYSPQSLLWERNKTAEQALWSALLALQEKSVLASRMSARARKAGRAVDARRHEIRSRRADEDAALLEQMLTEFDDEPEAGDKAGETTAAARA
jgi:two-component system chemotaxis response regulator CheB